MLDTLLFALTFWGFVADFFAEERFALFLHFAGWDFCTDLAAFFVFHAGADFSALWYFDTDTLSTVTECSGEVVLHHLCGEHGLFCLYLSSGPHHVLEQRTITLAKLELFDRAFASTSDFVFDADVVLLAHSIECVLGCFFETVFRSTPVAVNFNLKRP